MTTIAKVKAWHIPLNSSNMTLAEGKQSLDRLGAEPEDIPLIVRLVENPRYDIPGIEIFNGATDLKAHDYIHVLLGRGLLAHDEAFVIGFTMGSTNRVSTTEEALYSFFAKYLYPKPYRFGESAVKVFRDAVKLGYISRCKRLDTVDFTNYSDMSIADARVELGIEENLLKAYYEIEKNHYPENRASARLLD